MPAQTTKTTPAASLVDILVSQGVLSDQQQEEVKLEQTKTGQSFRQILVAKKLADEKQITQAEAQLKKIPFVDLEETAVSPQAVSLLPRAVAEKYLALPFDYHKAQNLLSVAMANPFDLAATEFIRQKSGASIKPFYAVPSKVKEIINVSYAQGLAAEVKAVLKETGEPSKIKAIDITQLGEVIRQAPIAKIVSTILEFAVRSRASDVHIEPGENKTRIRYRIDGLLHEKLVLPRTVHDAVISRIKILSDMKIDEKRLPQDGRFNFKAGDHEVDLRVSCLPSIFGEKIVMRLLKKGGGVPDLPELGLRGRALKNLEDAVLRPHGIIIVCGPTGSGKTTTLYSALSRINSVKVNIMTLEDPVEYQIGGVNQVQVNRAAGLTFATGLRSFVRQDPDIIMVGEIRDQETTELAIQSALTGHLVFSTLHTNDASGAVPRLIDLGAEPFLLASAMTCVVGQRVVRRICQDCKEEYDPPPEVVEDIKKNLGNLYSVGGKLKLFRGKKCPKCNNTGYLGRIGIFEVLPISEKIARLILERTPAGGIEKQALTEGMVTMKQDGYLKVTEGVTTIEEVLRVAQE